MLHQYLHYRFAELLIFPWRQAPEYAYDCIPAVGLSNWLQPQQQESVKVAAAATTVTEEGMQGIGDTVLRIALGVGTYAMLLGALGWALRILWYQMLNPSPDEASRAECSAALLALMLLLWLLLGLFPISGVPLRLGTLLAERLLYLPCAPTCALFALALQRLCGVDYFHAFFAWCGDESINHPANRCSTADSPIRTLSAAVSTITSKESSSCNSSTISSSDGGNSISSSDGGSSSRSRCLVLVAVVVAAYAWRTRRYAAVWKNDLTLFGASLREVCPRSAKMHLQMSKLLAEPILAELSSPATAAGKGAHTAIPAELQLSNLRRAWRHVRHAMRIDPDFCDVHYQRALLFLALDRNATAASEASLHSLHCPYTSGQAVNLLQQLWGLQLREAAVAAGSTGPITPAAASLWRQARVLEMQATLAQDQDVHSLAAQKFLEASMAAFDAFSQTAPAVSRTSTKNSKSKPKRGDDDNILASVQRLLHLSGTASEIAVHFPVPLVGTALPRAADDLSSEGTRNSVYSSDSSVGSVSLFPVPDALRCRIFSISGIIHTRYRHMMNKDGPVEDKGGDTPFARERGLWPWRGRGGMELLLRATSLTCVRAAGRSAQRMLAALNHTASIREGSSGSGRSGSGGSRASRISAHNLDEQVGAVHAQQAVEAAAEPLLAAANELIPLLPLQVPSTDPAASSATATVAAHIDAACKMLHLFVFILGAYECFLPVVPAAWRRKLEGFLAAPQNQHFSEEPGRASSTPGIASEVDRGIAGSEAEAAGAAEAALLVLFRQVPSARLRAVRAVATAGIALHAQGRHGAAAAALLECGLWLQLPLLRPPQSAAADVEETSPLYVSTVPVSASLASARAACLDPQLARIGGPRSNRSTGLGATSGSSVGEGGQTRTPSGRSRGEGGC